MMLSVLHTLHVLKRYRTLNNLLEIGHMLGKDRHIDGEHNRNVSVPWYKTIKPI